MEMTFFMRRVRAFFAALDERMQKYRLLLGALFALLLAGGFALMSVYAGPIYNLNDIGTFKNRVLFILMTAAVYALLLVLAAALHRGSVYRMFLRQMIVTAGLLILLVGINQKTYFYNENMQPLIRAMDAQGLGAMAGWKTNLSVPAMTLMYLVTRGPVYDMYSVKLLCIAAFLLLCLLTAFAADRRGMGLRADALLALCVILPAGFISAGCTALLDVVCAALLAASLTLALREKDCRWGMRAAAAIYGCALAMSGLALYALPVFAYLALNRRMTAREPIAALVIPVLACVPAVLAGVPVGEAMLSLLKANFALPEYAAGAPNMLSMIPRAVVEEMPGIFMLEKLPAIDAVTNAQPYYTQGHFEITALGFAIAGIAIYGGMCAWLWQKKEMTGTAKVFALTLCALIVCPGATNGAWIAAGLMSLYAICDEKALRLPACLVLFAVCGSALYPMLKETLLPMIAAFVLCLCALLMILEIIPTTLSVKENEN